MPENWLKLLKVLGLPTFGVLVLGYLYVIEIRADQREIKTNQTSLIGRSDAIVSEQANLARGILKLADKNGETQMLLEKILDVQRAMCVQQAETQADRRECLKGG